MSILSLQSISCEFGGLLALDAVAIDIQEQEIYGIIGPNGAGKTTLFNIITGIYTPSGGRIYFRDKLISGLPVYKVARLGIGRTFQNIRLFSRLSVLDNVRIGNYGVTPSNFFKDIMGLPATRRAERDSLAKADELLELVGLKDKRMEYAQSLSYGEQRRLEIARALALRPVLLLLDEPAAGMNFSEKNELMELINIICQQMRLTVLLVEHDMNVVMNVCHRIAVLDYGRKIAEGLPDQIKNDPQVIQSYLGVST